MGIPGLVPGPFLGVGVCMPGTPHKGTPLPPKGTFPGRYTTWKVHSHVLTSSEWPPFLELSDRSVHCPHVSRGNYP